MMSTTCSCDLLQLLQSNDSITLLSLQHTLPCRSRAGRWVAYGGRGVDGESMSFVPQTALSRSKVLNCNRAAPTGRYS
jgi:hypothetical protein